MGNRYQTAKAVEELLCGHPNTKENTLTLNATDGTLLAKCMTCKAEQVYQPGHWKKRFAAETSKFNRSKKKPQTASDTVKSEESKDSSETVRVVG